MLALLGLTDDPRPVPMDAVGAMVVALLAVVVAAIIRSVLLHVKLMLEANGLPANGPIPMSVVDPPEENNGSWSPNDSAITHEAQDSSC